MRKLSTGNVVVPYKVDEAGHTRDAMTKTLYSLLFEWIIKQINKTLEVCLGVVWGFTKIAHNRAIRPCHPSHSMPLALILPRGDQLYLLRKPLIKRDKGVCVCVCVFVCIY